MRRSKRPPLAACGAWIAVGVLVTTLTALLVIAMRRAQIDPFVQATVIVSLIPLLVFVD